MKTINSFFINKEKKSHHNCVLLKEFIEKFLDDGDLHLSLYEFSKIIDIPLDSIKDKSKQLMLSKFNFKTGKFNSNYSILKIFPPGIEQNKFANEIERSIYEELNKIY